MKLKIYAVALTLFVIGLVTLGSYRYNPYHGQMYMYESDGVLTVETQNAYIFLSDEDWQTGDVHGLTFSEGRTVDADITNEVDGSPQLVIDTSGVHSLTTGDEVSITGANNAGHNGVTTITVTDSDTFSCDNITYVANAGVSSAVVAEGAYLQLSAGGAGEFLLAWNLTAESGANTKNWKCEPFINSSEVDAAASEMTPSGTKHQSMGAQAIVSLSVGDRVYLAIKNEDGTDDLNLEHATLLLLPL